MQLKFPFAVDDAPKAPVRTLAFPRTVALWIVSTLVGLGVVVSFMESYRALYWWAQTHQVHGTWAVIWPIQIDAFVAVGELALFVALTDAWQVKHRSLPWMITVAGLAASIAGNVGHAPTHDLFTRLTFAVPSVTAYVMLAAALGLLKRVIVNQPRPEVTERKKPGPKPGSKRTPRAVKLDGAQVSLPDPEAATKAAAFATLPVDTDHFYGPLVAAGSGPEAPQMPEGWDGADTNAFPKFEEAA